MALNGFTWRVSAQGKSSSLALGEADNVRMSGALGLVMYGSAH